MSEDALNAAILSGWESKGLNAADDAVDTPDVDDAPTEDNNDSVDEPVDAPVDDAVDSPEPVDEPVADAPVEVEPVAEPVVEQTPAQEAQTAAEDELALSLGLGAPPADPKKRAAWWKSRVPYSQVHKLVTEREKKISEGHATALKEHTTRISEYDTRFKDVATVEDIIKNKPEQYLQTLAHLFPDTYGKSLASILKSSDPVQLAAAVQENDPGPMPEPDYDLGNGSRTYSVEGLQKRDEWVAAKIEQKLLKQFKPQMDYLNQQKQQAETQAQADARARRSEEVSSKAIAEAQTWDGAKENFDEMLKVASTLDPRYDAETALNIAYRQVVIPKMKVTQDEMRANLLKEAKKVSAAKTATSLTQTATRAKETAGDDSKLDLDTRIRNAMKRKGLSL